MIYKLEKKPILDATAFVAPDAAVIGNVELKKKASVWFNAVLRGDNEPITIGEESNIQDLSVLHTDPGFPLTVGKGVTVGHKVMLHGCQIGDYSLVGINSVILNGAEIGKYCLIGACALVTEGKKIPDRSVVKGVPGKVVKTLSDEECKMLELSAQVYVANAARYRENLTMNPD